MYSTALPDLSSEYTVTPEQIAQYRANGHVLLRGVCTPEEIAAYRPLITGTVRRFHSEPRPLEERTTYGRAFLQTINLWTSDPAVRGFTLARRFAKIAADLMEVEGARLYHDQALYKEAGGGHTPWHQDQFYWPLDTDRTVTMWMPLVDVSLEMGALTFASGSHRAGYLGHIGISDESQDVFDRLVEERSFPLAVDAMRAGDATFHSGWTLHTAPPNESQTDREVMTVIYFADGVRILNPIDNPNRQADLNAFLPGAEPGAMAASELTPVLYKRT